MPPLAKLVSYNQSTYQNHKRVIDKIRSLKDNCCSFTVQYTLCTITLWTKITMQDITKSAGNYKGKLKIYIYRHVHVQSGHNDLSTQGRIESTNFSRQWCSSTSLVATSSSHLPCKAIQPCWGSLPCTSLALAILPGSDGYTSSNSLEQLA